MNISNTGYQISISFAKLLRKVVPLNYFVGRFGGDERYRDHAENISGREKAGGTDPEDPNDIEI